MKKVYTIGTDLEKFSERLTQNLIKAQKNTADNIWYDLISNANLKTGAFIQSIEVEDTKQEGEKISTFIGSGLQVTSKAGNSYNLGLLLETGTSPHAIPNAFGFGENFGIDPNFHPRYESI